MKHDYHPAANTNLGTFTPDNLFCGGFQGVPKSVQLKHGVEHLRGEVVQESTTAGVYEICTDVTKAYGILVEDRNLTSATESAPGIVYITGMFNIPALHVGAGVDMDELTLAFEARNIYLKKTIGVTPAY